MPRRLFRTPAGSIPALAAMVGLATAQAAETSSWFLFQRGEVTTQVDGLAEYTAPYYPVGVDYINITDEGYFQAGLGVAGRYLYGLVALINEDAMGIDAREHGLDQSSFNLKGGAFVSGEDPLLFGTGFDIDWQANKYRETPGSLDTHRKTRVGIGPNLAIRLQFHPAFTLFPNVSGYWYPWPNKVESYLPRSLGGYGYRAEMPVIIDLATLFSAESRKHFAISAMPFIGSKSGFYKKDGSTGKDLDARASVAGVKFGIHMALGIFSSLGKGPSKPDF